MLFGELLKVVLLYELMIGAESLKCYVCSKCPVPFKTNGIKVKDKCPSCVHEETLQNGKVTRSDRTCEKCPPKKEKRSGSKVHKYSCCNEDKCTGSGKPAKKTTTTKATKPTTTTKATTRKPTTTKAPTTKATTGKLTTARAPTTRATTKKPTTVIAPTTTAKPSTTVRIQRTTEPSAKMSKIQSTTSNTRTGMPSTKETHKSSTTDNGRTQKPIGNSNATTAQKPQPSTVTGAKTTGPTFTNSQNSSNTPAKAQNLSTPTTSGITHSSFNKTEYPQTEKNLNRSTGNPQHDSEPPSLAKSNTTDPVVTTTKKLISNQTEPVAHRSATWISGNTSENSQTGNVETKVPMETSNATSAQKSQASIVTGTQTEVTTLPSTRSPSGITNGTQNHSTLAITGITRNSINQTENPQTEETLNKSTGNTQHDSGPPSLFQANTTAPMRASTQQLNSNQTEQLGNISAASTSGNTSETSQTRNAETHEHTETSNATSAQKSQTSISTDIQTADPKLPSEREPSDIPTETQDFNSPMTTSFTYSLFSEDESAQTEESLDSSSGGMLPESEFTDMTESEIIASTISTTQQSISDTTEPAADMSATWINEDTSETIQTENVETQETMESSSSTAAQRSHSSIFMDTQTADQSSSSGQNPSDIPTETQDHNSPMTNSFTHSLFSEDESAQTEESLDSSSGDMQHKSESPDMKEANTMVTTITEAQQSNPNPSEPAAHMPATWSSEDIRETNKTENVETQEPKKSSSSTAAPKSQSSILSDMQTADPALPSAQNPSDIPVETPDHSLPITIGTNHRSISEAEVLQTEDILDSSTGSIHRSSFQLAIVDIYLVSSLIACLN